MRRILLLIFIGYGLGSSLLRAEPESSRIAHRGDRDNNSSAPRFGIGGRIRQEGFLFARPVTFRTDTNDDYTFWRSKCSLDFTALHSTRADGVKNLEAYLRTTAFNFSDDNSLYTPVVEHSSYYMGMNFLKKAEVEKHPHRELVPLWYIEEVKLKYSFDDLLAADGSIGGALTVGCFPFSLGRGIALGDYFDGAVSYLGWDTPGNPGNGTQQSPGILCSIRCAPGYTFDLYYSKWRKKSHGHLYTREEVRAKRLDIDPDAIARGPYADRDIFAVRAVCETAVRGGGRARIEPYALYVRAPELKVEYEADSSGQFATVGVMLSYEHAGLKINAECASQLGTQVMHPIDRNHAVLGDSYYRETHGTTPPHNQARTELDDNVSAGRFDKRGPYIQKYHSHVLVGVDAETITTWTQGTAFENATAYSYIPYQAEYHSDDMRHEVDLTDADGGVITPLMNRRVNEHRSVDQNGEYVTEVTQLNQGTAVLEKPYKHKEFSGGSEYEGYRFSTGESSFDDVLSLVAIKPDFIPGTLANAQFPFGGGARFRRGYDIDYRGFMAMFDVSYDFTVGLGGSAFSSSSRAERGDRGKREVPFGVTCAATVGIVSGDDLPYNTEQNKTYKGFVPFKDANYSGLFVKSYALFGSRKLQRPSSFSNTLLYAPNNYEDLGNLVFCGAGLRFAPQVSAGTCAIELNGLAFWQHQPPYAWNAGAKRTYDDSLATALYAKLQRTLHFTGDVSSVRARSFLGYELNCSLSYSPIESLELRFLAGLFVPGGLYEDIQGMPNRMTVRVDKNGDARFESLGTKWAYGAMIRGTYCF